MKLIRRAEDSPWNVDSKFTYTMVAPHYVDFEFRCTPRDASKYSQRGYALFFFANYMNDVADVSLHFRGQDKSNAPEEWLSAAAPAGHPDWNGGGNYRSLLSNDLEYDDWLTPQFMCQPERESRRTDSGRSNHDRSSLQLNEPPRRFDRRRRSPTHRYQQKFCNPPSRKWGNDSPPRRSRRG